MSDFKPIMTQEEFNEAIKERLARQKEQHQKELDGLNDRIKQLESVDVDSYVQQVNGLTDALNKANEQIKNHEKELADRDGRIKEYEISTAKTKIASELGLSYDAAKFLQGEDEKAIRASAESLKSLVGRAEVPMGTPEPSGTGNKADQHREAMRTMLEGLNLKGEN